MKTTYSTCIGPALRGEHEGSFWCNAHLHLFTPGVPSKHDIVLDTEHPNYGEPASVVYPSDTWPFVVIGGSKSGQTLYIAPLDTTGVENGHVFTRDECIARMQPERARVIRSQRGKFKAFRGVALGIARTYLAPEL